ncbi:hypothetical protein QOT17_003661 [Balamuthia mandrillaris]
MSGNEEDAWGSEEDLFHPESKHGCAGRRNPLPRTAKRANARERPAAKKQKNKASQPATGSRHRTDDAEERQEVGGEDIAYDEEELIRQEIAKGTQGSTRLAKNPALRVLLAKGSLSLDAYRKHVLRLTPVPEDMVEKDILGCPINTPLEPTDTTCEEEEISVQWTPRSYVQYEVEHDQPISVFSLLNSERLLAEETANYLLYKENRRKQAEQERQENERMEEEEQNKDEESERPSATSPRTCRQTHGQIASSSTTNRKKKKVREPHSPGHVMTVNELSLDSLREVWKRWEGSIVRSGGCWMLNGTDNKKLTLEKAEEERWRCYCHHPKDGNDGYLQATVENRKYFVHEISWLLHYRVLVHGLEVSHLCHNSRCITPEHLTLEPAGFKLFRRRCRKCQLHLHQMHPSELRCEAHFPPCIYSVFEPRLSDE